MPIADLASLNACSATAGFCRGLSHVNLQQHMCAKPRVSEAHLVLGLYPGASMAHCNALTLRMRTLLPPDACLQATELTPQTLQDKLLPHAQAQQMQACPHLNGRPSNWPSCTKCAQRSASEASVGRSWLRARYSCNNKHMRVLRDPARCQQGPSWTLEQCAGHRSTGGQCHNGPGQAIPGSQSMQGLAGPW